MRAVLLGALLALAGLVGLASPGLAQSRPVEGQVEGMVAEDLAPPSPPPIPIPPVASGGFPSPPLAGSPVGGESVEGTQPGSAPVIATPVAGPVSSPSPSPVKTPANPPSPAPIMGSAPLGSTPIGSAPLGSALTAAPSATPAVPGRPVPADASIFPGVSSWGVNLIGALGAFILVLGLLLLFLRLIGRLGQGRNLKGGRTFVLRGTMALDSRRYLAAVEIDGQLLVVGVTPERLTALGQWPLAVEDEPFRDLPPEPSRVADLSSKGLDKKFWLKTQAEKKLQTQPEAGLTQPTSSQSAPTQPTSSQSAPTQPAPTPPPRPVAPATVEALVSLEPAGGDSVDSMVILDPPEKPSPKFSVPTVAPDLGKALEPSLQETIELEPLSLRLETEEPPGERVFDEETESLGLGLSLDEEPFLGPETNDDFLGLGEIDDPPGRRG